VLPSADVLDLLTHELAGGGGRLLALREVLLRLLDGAPGRHVEKFDIDAK
jgi:hypothetical protein